MSTNADILRRVSAKQAQHDPRISQLREEIDRLSREAEVGSTQADPRRVELLAAALRKKLR